ncbi:MAG: hypothetical protein PHS79_03945 [Patescibacteria group bacterium]|nr:hypothetical protein [Patescibacteria group bacterium]
MAIVHYLNVREGDCSIIQHNSGRVTVIDVCNARLVSESERLTESLARKFAAAQGNFNQKEDPDNPIAYMRDRSIDAIFRFILSHPDMDHLDGIADLFAEFGPINFWDTDNTCDKSGDNWEASRYRREDWDLYKSLRTKTADPKRLVYYSGQPRCDFWKDDGLHVLSPTPDLVKAANENDEWNDASHVILYKTGGRKILFPGDCHDDTWAHILENHADSVTNIDLLIAPHHGRHSDCDFTFLDMLQPKLTLFGNAKSEHLAYREWSRRNLPKITNNQAGSIIVDFDSDDEFGAWVYCTNKTFAETVNGNAAKYHESLKAWRCALLPR